MKKQLADIALNAARSKGASYADVRIGRYRNQFIITREDKVLNTVDTESYGIGIRVIASGCWGFASTDRMDTDGIAQAAETGRFYRQRKCPAPERTRAAGAAERHMEKSAGKPRSKKMVSTFPISEKADLLLGVNAAAMKAGASFVDSALFLVNEQKYFASTDGSYIDQDIHRIWPTFTVNKDRNDKTGKFETRDALSAPMGMGYEYLMPDESTKIGA